MPAVYPTERVLQPIPSFGVYDSNKEKINNYLSKEKLDDILSSNKSKDEPSHLLIRYRYQWSDTMLKARAFSPGHITGFFQLCDDTPSPLRKGSRGAGVSLTHGVTTEVHIKKSHRNRATIRINKRRTRSAHVSERALNLFLSRVGIKENHIFEIDHCIGIPIGAGFGSSGAGALSLVFALNKAFKAGLSREEAAQIAHVAEVECKTGLGTVIGETFGGLEIRAEPGAPGIGRILRLRLEQDTHDYRVVCLVFGPLSTKRLLQERRLRAALNRIGGELVDKIIKDQQVRRFMEYSREFAERTGLISSRIRPVLSRLDELPVRMSMLMFGEGVFGLVDSDTLKKVFAVFGEYSGRAAIITSEIDCKGVRVIDEY